MDFGTLVMPLLTNPVSLGIIVKVVLDALKGVLKQVDDKGLAEQNKKWLEPVLVILTLVTSGISLAMQGKLSELDLNQLSIWLQAFVTQMMISHGTGTQTTTAAAKAVVNTVVNKNAK